MRSVTGVSRLPGTAQVPGNAAPALTALERPASVAFRPSSGWSVRWPMVGLLLIFGTIALFGSESLFGWGSGIRWVEVDILLLVCGAGWLAGIVMSRTPGRLSRLDLAVLFFALAVVVSTWYGLFRGIPLSDIRSELRPPGYLVLTYAIARRCVRDQGGTAKVFTIVFLVSLLAAAKALAVYAIFPLAPAGGPEQIHLATRVLNSGGFKRILAQGAEIFPLLAAILLLPQMVRPRSAKAQVGIWLALVILLLSVAISLTRSYWLGLAAGVVWLLVKSPARTRFRLLGLLAVTALVLIGVGVVLTQVAPSLGVSELVRGAETRGQVFGAHGWDVSVRERMLEVEAIARLVADSPWFGTGLGGTYSYYSTLSGGIREWEYTHNSYAYWLMKFGLVGFVPVGILLSLGLASAVRWVRRSRDESARALASGVSACLVALLTLSVSAPWLTHYVGAAWAGLILGTCESRRLAEGEGEST